MESYDIAVIGMGPGGEHVAGTLAERGLRVLGIESALVGGECPYWGCIPSKMMIRAADLLAELSFTDPNGEVQTVAQRLRLWPAAVVVAASNRSMGRAYARRRVSPDLRRRCDRAPSRAPAMIVRVFESLGRRIARQPRHRASGIVTAFEFERAA